MSARLPARRLLTRGALALLLPASLLAGSATGSASEPAPPSEPAANVAVKKAKRQWVKLEALPPIVQHGRGVASPDAARAALTATLRPVRVGRRFELQVQQDDMWSVVATARQDRRGRAQFAAASTDGKGALTYRVKALPFRGLRKVTSAPVSTARWQRASWTDEFSGDQLDPVWNHRGREYVKTARRSCSKGDPRAVTVGGGAARLSVIKDPDTTKKCRIRGRDAVPGKYAYRLNGHIGTQGAYSFRYGHAAARVKFHRLRGQHGAFWLQPADGMHPASTGAEIDVVEYFGDRHPQGGLATFMHRYDARGRVSSGGWIPNSRSYLHGRRDGWSKNYHVFSVEWTPRTVVFRIDGKETRRMRVGISDVRQFPILSLIAADYEIPKIQGSRLPQHMYVDWVRVWETPEP
ncbi:glycoside hydrolase family 16 protein [Nocardioides lacusdianchii]|uniref:glycoside hydrolase family 16 protein n=1 Tax=Nocardioides lacusdianchii TaxID=2783664 RepID=UPI001CD02218|nr:glycoside hydrolase family 16 protein [Nocardioides lacusdianchii]